MVEVEAHAHGGGPVLRGRDRVRPARRPAAGRHRRRSARYDGWTGVGGAREARPYGPNGVDYFVSEADNSFFRLRQPTDEQPVPAAVSPELAELAGDDGPLAVHVPAGRWRCASSRRCGTSRACSACAVVVDRDALGVALHPWRRARARRTKSGSTRRTPPATRLARALARPPFDGLEVESRAELRHRLDSRPAHARDDPAAARGDGDRARCSACSRCFSSPRPTCATGSGELLDLETQGAEPRALRRHLRLRLLLVALPGILGGALAGLALSGLVVGFVELTLTADVPEPPLVLGADWGLLLLVLAAFLAAAAAVAMLRSRSAFRAAYAGRSRMTSRRSRRATSSTSTRARRGTRPRCRG